MKPGLLRTFLHLIATAVIALALLDSPALAQDTPGPDAAPATDAGTAAVQDGASAFPPGLADPSVTLEELQLRLIPLTVDELGPLAAAWQDRARAATQAVVDKSLEIRAAEGAAADPLRAERLTLLAERGSVFERFAAVVSSLEAKGGDPAEVQRFRNYIAAVAVQETSRLTFQELADSAWNWLLSRDGGVQLAFRIAVVVGALFVLFVVARIVRGWVRHLVERVPNLSMLLRGFIVMVVYWLTIAFGLMVVLAVLGVNITPLFALVGGASFIIAFALQDTLGNLAAGLMIMINRPFDEGDYVSVAGTSGTVKSVSIVSTTVATPDNRVIVIPNSKVWGDVITNTSASDTRRVDLVFGIGYGDSIAEAQAVIEKVVADHPLVLRDPAPVIRVNELSASSVDFVCRPWVRSEDYLSVYWDITRAVKEAFDAHGISIPYPQTDMHLHLAPADVAALRAPLATAPARHPGPDPGEARDDTGGRRNDR